MLPRGLPQKAVLYYSAPRDATEDKIARACAQAGLDEVSDDTLEVRAFSGTGDQVRSLCHVVSNEVTSVEQETTRVLLVASDSEVGVRELIHMEALSSLVARVEGERIVELLRENRLTSWFQPIVELSNGTDVNGGYTVFAYECLARGVDPDGSLINPGEMFSVAREAGLLFYLDRAARLSAIEHATTHQVSSTIFINFNPTAIYSPENCLATTIEAIEKRGIPRERIVFEVVESDSVGEVSHLRSILDYYRSRGFRVALDDMGAGFNSLLSLNDLRPDFVKMDIELIRGVDADPFKARIASNMLDLANKLEIPSVVEGVENEGEYQWVREHGAHYAQGFFFARPAPVPPVPQVSGN